MKAAGRVIRTLSDSGSIHLIDDRFTRPEVLRLLPSWWNVGDTPSERHSVVAPGGPRHLFASLPGSAKTLQSGALEESFSELEGQDCRRARLQHVPARLLPAIHLRDVDVRQTCEVVALY
jgi:hypothetical protein